MIPCSDRAKTAVTAGGRKLVVCSVLARHARAGGEPGV